MSLADVRGEIDRLDDQIIKLLTLRQRQVARAATYKHDEEGVRAPDRRSQMMKRLHQRRDLIKIARAVVHGRHRVPRNALVRAPVVGPLVSI